MRAPETKILSVAAGTNRIIAGLPAVERTQLLNRGKEVDLVFGDIVVEPGATMRHVYFPSTAFISSTASTNGSGSLEVALIGSEGMFGLSVALGASESSMRGIVQGPGKALRVAADELRDALHLCPELRRTLHAYADVMITQIAQVAVCASYHVVEARLARWLLMTHDRAQNDTFNITHELMAEMLGVRRAGVSTAASALQARGLIRYSRGRITVTDRAGLEAASCECYIAATRSYEKVMSGLGPVTS